MELASWVHSQAPDSNASVSPVTTVKDVRNRQRSTCAGKVSSACTVSFRDALKGMMHIRLQVVFAKALTEPTAFARRDILELTANTKSMTTAQPRCVSRERPASWLVFTLSVRLLLLPIPKKPRIARCWLLVSVFSCSKLMCTYELSVFFFFLLCLILHFIRKLFKRIHRSNFYDLASARYTPDDPPAQYIPLVHVSFYKILPYKPIYCFSDRLLLNNLPILVTLPRYSCPPRPTAILLTDAGFSFHKPPGEPVFFSCCSWCWRWTGGRERDKQDHWEQRQHYRKDSRIKVELLIAM